MSASETTARPPLFDLATPDGREGFERRLQRLADSAAKTSDADQRFAQAAAENVRAVRERGDDAIVELERRWTNPDFTVDMIRVGPEECATALDQLDRELRAALQRSIEHVTTYQQHVMPSDTDPVRIGDAELGLRWTPVDSAGCLVPGGSAVLFSTLIMLGVPAVVAGVPREKIAAVNPAPYRKEGDPPRDLSPIFKAACAMLEIGNVYRIGGAQAVAALAFGTETVQRVDMIAGPGHPVVQHAKALVAGATGTDNGFYGPSEIVTLADESADPKRVAADLLAQAEHDPGKCFLVCWDDAVAEAILKQLDKQLPQRSRKDAIVDALRNESCVVLTDAYDTACDVANRLATEHLNLAVADPGATLQHIRHAGEAFLGDATPVAAGDYYAGPSHCLPTGTTARFTSGVSVYTFMKRTGTVAYPDGMSEETIADIARLAEAEGLDAHAASARVRGA
ncbi:MAG: histidinol dehydrogenase [Planctomycetota bacterium]